MVNTPKKRKLQYISRIDSGKLRARDFWKLTNLKKGAHLDAKYESADFLFTDPVGSRERLRFGNATN